MFIYQEVKFFYFWKRYRLFPTIGVLLVLNKYNANSIIITLSKSSALTGFLYFVNFRIGELALNIYKKVLSASWIIYVFYCIIAPRSMS